MFQDARSGTQGTNAGWIAITVRCQSVRVIRVRLSRMAPIATSDSYQNKALRVIDASAIVWVQASKQWVSWILTWWKLRKHVFRNQHLRFLLPSSNSKLHCPHIPPMEFVKRARPFSLAADQGRLSDQYGVALNIGRRRS